MIVCSCRRISNKDPKWEEEIKQNPICGKCIETEEEDTLKYKRVLIRLAGMDLKDITHEEYIDVPAEYVIDINERGDHFIDREYQTQKLIPYLEMLHDFNYFTIVNSGDGILHEITTGREKESGLWP